MIDDQEHQVGANYPLMTEKVYSDRKVFFLDLKENARGRFLKITEDVRGRRDQRPGRGVGLQLDSEACGFAGGLIAMGQVESPLCCRFPF